VSAAPRLAGTVKRMRVPRSATGTQIRPPCVSTIARAIASPSPAPSEARAASAPAR
jgi:hypothetical protein